MSHAPSPPIDLRKIKSLLFLRLGKLGDLMVASWLFQRVREKHPHLRLGLLTLPRSEELFRFNPDLDVIKVWQPLTLPVLSARERLRTWDLMVDLNDDASRSSVLALRLLKPRFSMAYHHHRSAGVFEYTLHAPPKDKSHALERLAVAAEALGVGAPLRRMKPVAYIQRQTFLKETALRKAATEKVPRAKVVALNLSAGHGSRYWPLPKWMGLAKALQGKGKNIWLRVLADPKDRHLVTELEENLEASRLLPKPGPSLNEFLTAIATSDLLISPDTSAVHAAAAFGVPVVGLYPEPLWNFVSWRPMGVKNIALRSPSAEGGVEAIPLEPVLKAALKLLK